MIFWFIACVTKNITGSVQTANHEPLDNAVIHIATYETRSDAGGIFMVTDANLKKGSYPIKITHQGYEFYQDNLLISGSSFAITPIILNPLEITIPYIPINFDDNLE